ncbi:hypothetical protein [Hymenobacter koreensis]|uniref:hypothetical protein n=1 Tax=Hymenobacter koreensis TaxID=1084523 RepID=UPI0031E8C3E1
MQNGNIEALIEAVRGCSLGQVTNALFEVGGRYRRKRIRTLFQGSQDLNVFWVSDEGVYMLRADNVITLKAAFFGGPAQVYGGTLTLLQVR